MEETLISAYRKEDKDKLERKKSLETNKQTNKQTSCFGASDTFIPHYGQHNTLLALLPADSLV